MHVTIADAITFISLLVAIEMAIGHGTIALTNAIPEKWIPTVQSWCNILAGVGSLMITALSRYAGAGMLLLALLLLPADVWAQAKPLSQTLPGPKNGPIHQGLEAVEGARASPAGQAVRSGTLMDYLADEAIAKVLPDLKYAAALAHQNSNTVTAPCLDAILGLVGGWQAPIKDETGAVMALPDPHAIVTLERASELLAQLQPNSSLSLGCAATAQASQKDVITLLGSLLSGGALGLLKLPIIPLP